MIAAVYFTGCGSCLMLHDILFQCEECLLDSVMRV